MNPYTHIIFGPPGTGKTTELIGIVERLIKSGMDPESICYVGFTRRSAREARERATEKLNLSSENLTWFRTLHSLAFHAMGLSNTEVMGVRDYIAVCDMLGLSITLRMVNEDGTFAGSTKGDRLLFMECMARSRMLDLKKYWESCPDEDIYFYELLQLRETLEAYKANRGKQDFTDIIYSYVNENHPLPPCKTLIVDEAQDLTPLQWKMVDKPSNHIGETHVAGDDDQAIFRWAGADVEKLITLDGDRRILNQSYRVPKKVQQLANEVAARIGVRVAKNWEARDADGSVDYYNSLDEVDLSSGTWLLLARNTYLLDYYIELCLRDGIIFDAKGLNCPINGNSFTAIKIWESLREGYQVTGAQAKILYEQMSSKTSVAYGFKGKIDEVPDKELLDLRTLQMNHGCLRKGEESWDNALDKIPSFERDYFLAAIRRGESLKGKTRIRISTIHGAKGAEADNVVLQTDMADRTWREFEASPDDEHRVWYVASTRAKERLIILTPQTNKCYNI